MITIKANPIRGAIELGRRGEHMVRRVEFDVSEWQREIGPGVVQILAQRTNDETPYPVSVEISGNTVTWVITEADTAYVGYGRCELQYRQGEAVAKSKTWMTQTQPSLGDATENPPEAHRGWLDQVLEAGANTVAAVANPPMLSPNNTWVVMDAETGAYVDTGVSAIGEVGPTGAAGKSAYQIAVENGYEGSEVEWLESLVAKVSPPLIGEITLLASAWNGENNLYSQAVDIEGVTENSQVDLTPSVEQLVIFYEKDLTFVTENDGGVVTVYAIGQRPMNDYTIQVTITEVAV